MLTGFEDAGCILLVQYRVQWQAIVNTVIIIWVWHKTWNSLDRLKRPCLWLLEDFLSCFNRKLYIYI